MGNVRPIARINDITVSVCCCHPSCPVVIGFLFPFQNLVNTDDRLNIRCGDISIHTCGHISVVVTCSSLTNVENSFQARLNDIVVGCPVGIIVTGSNLGYTE